MRRTIDDSIPDPNGTGNVASCTAAILPSPALMFVLIGYFSRKPRNRMRGFWLTGGSVVVLFTVLAGCGGGSTPPPQPQSYVVTVTAVSGSIQHLTTVSLTVQ